ncbi:MAG TPA: type II secretion system F family protein [Methylomirabilota bacterium]|nr:type II secretion system F family protein [Methylomirabilota bacterium]
MPAFRYRALSPAGEAQQGLLDASDLDQAVERLHNMGLVPVRLEPHGAAKLRIDRIPFLQKRVAPRDLILFTRQLETMLDSGLPILSSLESLHDQTTHARLKPAIDRVRSDVEQGSTLTEALRRQPDCFPRIYVNLVHAGEEGGLLAQMLDRVATLLEYEAETDQRVRSATFYPTLIVTELGLAFLVLIKFVLPRFASLFRKFDAQLPLPTRVLIGLSDFFEKQWLPFLFFLACAAAGAVLWSRTERGRVAIDRFVITVPIFGPIFLMTIMSRFSRVLAALLASGIPIVQALDVVRGVVGNRVVETEVDKMRDGVVAGMGLAEPLKGSPVVPPLVVKMLSVGEETGAVDKMLNRVSRYYDQDVDYAVKNLSTAIEPVLLMILGAAVLFTALAVFLPLWNLMNVFRH